MGSFGLEEKRLDILVTGGAGFIGSEFVRQLVTNNTAGRIKVLDSLTYASNFESIREYVEAGRVEFFERDLRSLKGDEGFLANLDVVVNFAAETHVDNSIDDPSLFFDTNVIGTHKLLEICRRLGTGKFIQISTDEVYGSIRTGQASEKSPLSPSSPYAASKASADHLVLSYFRTYGFPVIVTRCSNNYGVGQHSEKFLPTVISSIRAGKPIPVYGNGKNVREWISVADHVNGILRAIDFGEPGNVFNFGSSERVSNLEVLEKCMNICGKDKVRLQFVNDRPGHDFRYAIDSSKAKSLLGFSARTTLDEFLENALSD